MSPSPLTERHGPGGGHLVPCRERDADHRDAEVNGQQDRGWRTLADEETGAGVGCRAGTGSVTEGQHSLMKRRARGWDAGQAPGQVTEGQYRLQRAISMCV